MYKLKYSRKARKFLLRTEKNIANRIIDKIEKISEKPIIPDTKRIEGIKGLYRIRVGNFRILYEIDYDNNLIGIVKIDSRSNIYKEMS